MHRLLITLLILLCLYPAAAQDATPSIPYLRSPRLGIAHISGSEEETSPTRYQNALALGAGWNRWPLYWDRVEAVKGGWDWGNYDRLVTDDTAQGLSIDAVLLGRPKFYQDKFRIIGINEAAFADGTDTLAPNKQPNPNNPWAVYVYQAVQRYKPNGILAQQSGWDAERGVRVWEIWNEPDYKPFWEGSVTDYARLLKVAYLMVKLADPQAQVMLGGLLYASTDNWLARVLAVFQGDPFHEQYNWYMDIVSFHNYSYPWRTGWLALVIDQTLKAYKIKRPVWLNESGVPVWDDYPGMHWTSKTSDKMLHATSQQQANFFIQSFAYGLQFGVDVFFYHQLYDDCGNQPGNFPYHNGELCKNGVMCSGDAYGLFRNESNAVCFSHNPEAGTPRPSAQAYQLIAQLFGTGDLNNPQEYAVGKYMTVLSIDRPATKQRYYFAWNRTLTPIDFRWTPNASPVIQFTLEGNTWLLPNKQGEISVTLPAAECDYFPYLEPGDVTAIGGETLIFATNIPSKEVQFAALPPQGKLTRCTA